MQIPKIDKVVINVGAGEAKDNAKVIDAIMNDLATITGQKPVVCRAKKSVANFKIREGVPIGVKVTLRSEKMYEFLDRLFNVAFLVYVITEALTQLIRRKRDNSTGIKNSSVSQESS
jgi:large subunit ribosomal protein L5